MRSSMSNEYFEQEVGFIREDEYAICVEDVEGNAVWFPHSEIKDVLIDYDLKEITFWATELILAEKGWV